jgi:hypothetical protein
MIYLSSTKYEHLPYRMCLLRIPATSACGHQPVLSLLHLGCSVSGPWQVVKLAEGFETEGDACKMEQKSLTRTSERVRASLVGAENIEGLRCNDVDKYVCRW